MLSWTIPPSASLNLEPSPRHVLVSTLRWLSYVFCLFFQKNITLTEKLLCQAHLTFEAQGDLEAPVHDQVWQEIGGWSANDGWSEFLFRLVLKCLCTFFSLVFFLGVRRDVEGEGKSCRPPLSISHVPVLTELIVFSFFQCVTLFFFKKKKSCRNSQGLLDA